MAIPSLRLADTRRPVKGSRISWKFLGQAQHIEHPSLSAASLSMVKGWLDNCLAREGPHVDCGKETETVLPKRVILVGLEEADAVRLHIPSKGETGRYVALSHCWGDQHQRGRPRVPLTNLLRRRSPPRCQRPSRMRLQQREPLASDTYGLTLCASFRILPKIGWNKPQPWLRYTVTLTLSSLRMRQKTAPKASLTMQVAN